MAEEASVEKSVDESTRQRADAPAPLARPKRIAVFSDGTGNSSSALFRTNVFRLYSALDLGTPGIQSAGKSKQGSPTSKDQIAYYDNGVGTSSFRLFATLGGIFGFGLKHNLLEIYKFICRNYNDVYPNAVGGDSIYAFGFSRGSFTIRLLVALICTQGIVPYKDERELHRNCTDALRRFLGQNAPDNFPWLFQSVRKVRDWLIAGWRSFCGQKFNVAATSPAPDIEFVGVWDTVSAYGGPIVELTRGIDQYVWPLTMTDYSLHPNVKVARHALALDDERDSFWPLLWDEQADQYGKRGRTDPLWSPEQQARAGTRIKQVWFAGMHSDVGGGYPDDSLAYVSLEWMIGELANLTPDKQLRLLPGEAQRVAAFANPLGPIHDSRQGMSAFYRYQPRKIAAMLHRSIADTVGMNQTRILRDPTIGEKLHRPQGLLNTCLIHRSVIERIAVGADNYAPIGLPRKFQVEPPFDKGDASPIAESTRKLEDRRAIVARGEIQENAWDLVWLRRVCYFFTISIVLLLATSPLWTAEDNHAPKTDSRLPLNDLFELFRKLVPGIVDPWYSALTHYWPITAIALFMIGLLLNFMTQLESSLRDRMRITWWEATDWEPAQGPQLEKIEPTALRVIRNSVIYQAVLQFMKWRVMPFVCGAIILLFVPYLGLIIWTQASLWGMERETGVLCGDPQAVKGVYENKQLTDGPSGKLDFNPTEPCSDFVSYDDGSLHPPGEKLPPIIVTEGKRYFLVIEETRNGGWIDKNHHVPIRGWSSSNFGWPASAIMFVTAPLRRVVKARWLEPLVELRSLEPESSVADTPRRTVEIDRLDQSTPVNLNPAIDAPNNRKRYIGSFVAQMTGTVHIFLNDAMLPKGTGIKSVFYDNNKYPAQSLKNDGMVSKNIYTTSLKIWPESRFMACYSQHVDNIFTAVSLDTICPNVQKPTDSNSQGTTPPPTPSQSAPASPAAASSPR